jgi:hypothetical protein
LKIPNIYCKTDINGNISIVKDLPNTDMPTEEKFQEACSRIENQEELSSIDSYLLSLRNDQIQQIDETFSRFLVRLDQK